MECAGCLPLPLGCLLCSIRLASPPPVPHASGCPAGAITRHPINLRTPAVPAAPDFACGVVGADGRHVLLDRGHLPTAVTASAAIPVVFSPVPVPGACVQACLLLSCCPADGAVALSGVQAAPEPLVERLPSWH